MNKQVIKPKIKNYWLIGNKHALGYNHTEETKKRVSESLKGRTPWSKGKNLPDSTKQKISDALKGRFFSVEHRKKLSDAAKGKKKILTNEWRKHLGDARRGKPLSIEHRRSIGEAQKGEKNHAWRGGKTSIYKKIRSSFDYRIWREAVFKRDNFTCMFCQRKGGRLNADHIKPFSLYPDLRMDINNGRTLCVDCHKKTDTYCRKIKT